jgi:nitrogen fixation protein NifB
MDDSSNFEFAAAEPLDDIMQKIADHKGCGTSGGSGKSSCGTSDGPDDMAPEIWEKVKNHPCYSEEAHHHYARMHVAVAPACNIQCNYCNRKYDCANESRPGVVSEKLTPEQAAKKVLAVASTIPQMTVLGVAGPGDPLANPAKTFKTFELISQTAPDIKLCLSTNGLALPDHVDTIAKYNVDHVTITVNMVDPEVGAQIYPWIFWKNKRVTGIEAARILTERQMQGLEMLTERGILCKVNSVMIPGINDKHLVEVNRAVKSRGARTWHGVWSHRPARTDGARTEGVAGQLRRRDEHDAALPPMSRRRGGPARGRPLRGIHHGKDHGNGGFLRSRIASSLSERGRTRASREGRGEERRT